tara:strand:- start:1201 stop:1689 length:489 start_codon:yes stop_codon:yes gene_type:complete
MATTTSFGDSPGAITAIDGSVTRNANLTVETYSSLSVPAGATVNGIVVTWTGGYSSDIEEAAPVMSVGYEGSGNSNLLQANDSPAYFSDISTVTYGAPTHLWGLSWTVAQANAIFTKMATDSGTFYHDAFQVTIHYTAAAAPSSIEISQGTFNLAQGKITIS